MALTQININYERSENAKKRKRFFVLTRQPGKWINNFELLNCSYNFSEIIISYYNNIFKILNYKIVGKRRPLKENAFMNQRPFKKNAFSCSLFSR